MISQKHIWQNWPLIQPFHPKLNGGVLRTEYKQDMVTLMDITPPPPLATPTLSIDEKCEPLELTVTTKVKANAVKQEELNHRSGYGVSLTPPWPRPLPFCSAEIANQFCLFVSTNTII